MTQLSTEQLYEIETRKLALEEQREANRAREATRTPKPSSGASPLTLALISLVSAAVGGAASLGGAYFTGAFKVQETQASNRGEADLARLQFQNELIDEALDEGSDRERALRLQFMVDVGIFDDSLNAGKIGEYAQAEIERLESGQPGESILPRSLSGDGGRNSVAPLFQGGNPVFDTFQDPAVIAEFAKHGLLDNPRALAIVLSNIHFESGGYRFTTPRWNYSASQLSSLFRRQFRDVDPAAYARNPEKILNRVYANRMGNGTEASGDGYRFRGRGIWPIYGRTNHEEIGRIIGVDLVANPDLATGPVIGLKIALAYFARTTRSGNTLIDHAQAGDAETVRKGVNGGLNGFDHVQRLEAQYLQAFSDPLNQAVPLVSALTR